MLTALTHSGSIPGSALLAAVTLCVAAQFCARLDFAVDDAEGGKGLTVSEVRVLQGAAPKLTSSVRAASHSMADPIAPV